MTDRPATTPQPAAGRPADRLHLSPRHRTQIEALLREHLPGVEVWAYGSRITGESHDGSDLDLVLRAPDLQKIPIGRLSDLWEVLRESTIPFLVEARDWARLPEGFHGEIERDYVVLVEGARADAADSTAPTRVVDTEWVNSTIGEIADVSGGGTPSTKDLSNFGGDIPWITPKDLSGSPDRYVSQGARNLSEKGLDSSAARLLPAGTVLLSTRAPIGYVAIAANPVTTNQGFRNLVLKDGFSPEFYYYWLTNNVPELERHATGSTFKEISGTVVKQINIPIPPFSEQRAIAHVLGALDDKIELNRRMNETLEAMARALFRSWFVDFDPVRARMEGRDTGLPKEIADLFPDRLVDSPIGWTPEGWAVAPLTELMEVNPKRSLSRGQVAPYLDMANMPTRGHVPDSVVDRPVGSGTRFTNGDTLVARITPCLENGKTAYVDFLLDSEIGWGSTEYIVLKPRRPLPGEFAYCLARSARFREFAIRNMSGTSGRQRVPAAALSGFGMSAPSARAVAEFGRLVRPLFGRASRAARESRRLARLRDALLPELVSGALRVDRTAPPVRCA